MSETATIRNVVFDIGNVVVHWDSLAIVERAFGDTHHDIHELRRDLFVRTDTWLALNRGELTVDEAKQAYVDDGHLSPEGADRLFAEVFAFLDPMPGTEPLMRRLSASGYRLFALTDNVHEIVAHLKERHEFWPLFEGAAVSAEIGVLKPDPRIYRHLLGEHDLIAAETVFFDDLPGNVEGAKAVGMQAFVFTGAEQAERDLRSIGVDPDKAAQTGTTA